MDKQPCHCGDCPDDNLWEALRDFIKTVLFWLKVIKDKDLKK